MQYDYNLTAVGIDPFHFPYLCPGKCMGLDCVQPGAEVEFLRWCLQSINATMTVYPATIDTDEMLMMEHFLVTTAQNDLRQDQVDYTTSIGMSYVGYIVKESTQIEVGDYFGEAFPQIILLMMLLAGFSVSCLLHLSTKLLTNESSSVIGFAYFAVAGFFKNSNLDPKPVSSRMLVTIWLLFTFVLTEYYGAKLRSVLLLTHYRGFPFQDMNEALDAMEHHGWKMVYNDSSFSPFLFCYDNQCAKLRELQARSLIEFNEHMSLEEVAEIDHHFGFGPIQNDIAPHRRILLDDTKRILFIRDRLISPVHRSYAVRRNMSELLEKLNRAIALAYGGFHSIRNRYREPFLEYINSHFQENANVLKLEHLITLFEMVAKLLLFAIAFFLGEIVYYRHSQLLINWILKAQHRLGFHTEEMGNKIELTYFSRSLE